LSLTKTVKKVVAGGEQVLVAVMITLVIPLLKTEPLPVPLPLAVVEPLKAYDSAGAGKPVAVAV
jgi:hypothetical protein